MDKHKPIDLLQPGKPKGIFLDGYTCFIKHLSKQKKNLTIRVI